MSAGVLVRPTLLVVAGLLGSCAAFRDGKLESIEDWPPASPSAKRAINIEVAGNVVGGLKGAWRTQALRAMKDSGLFAGVTASSRTDAPLRATVRVTYQNTTNQGLLALSGFTLMLVPVPAGTASFTVETTFYDAGVVKGSIRRTEGCTVWMQLLLLFAAPFATEDSAYYDCLRATLVEAARKQWFGATGVQRAPVVGSRPRPL